MSILLAGAVVWISVVGPAGTAMAAGLGWHCPNLVQIRMHCLCPDLGGMLPPPPLPSTPPSSRRGAKGFGRDLVLSSLSVLLLRGPTGPSLTLANAPLAREHRGPPIPVRHWLPCWLRSTGAPGDTAGRPGLGAGASVGGSLPALSQHLPPGPRHRVCQLLQGVPEHLQQETQDQPLEAGTSS